MTMLIACIVFAATTFSQGAGWLPAAFMSTKRTEAAVVALSDGKVLLIGGRDGTTRHASVEIYDPATNTWSATGSLATARSLHSATLLENGRVLVVGGTSDGSSGLPTTEIYNPDTGTWSSGASISNPRHSHTATLLVDGKLLIAGGENGTSALSNAERYTVSSNTWSNAGDLSTPRKQHTATLLGDGKVLVVGGRNSSGATNSAMIYTPSTNSWTSANNPVPTARFSHTANLLANGRVLVAGGETVPAGYLASAAIFDPALGTWSATGSLSRARSLHTAALLPNGTVMVINGRTATETGYSGTEVFDPATGIWSGGASPFLGSARHVSAYLGNGRIIAVGGESSVASNAASLYDPTDASVGGASALSRTRNAGSLSLLSDGRVMYAGGESSCACWTDFYYPTTNTWGQAPDVPDGRLGQTSTNLPDGRLMMIGNVSFFPTAPAFWNPATSSWYADAPLNESRSSHTATLLADGRLMVAGGTRTDGSLLNHVEIYTPRTNTWEVAAPMNTARHSHRATLLTNGKVLVAGGYTAASNAIASAELYDPATNTWSAAGALANARAFHALQLMHDGRVVVVGGWASGYTSTALATEIYNPTTNTWATGAAMTTVRTQPASVLLPDGRLFVIGGDYVAGNVSSTQIYDLARNQWVSGPTLTQLRAGGHSAILLPNGKVLVAGGNRIGGGANTHSELLDVSTPTLASLRPAVTSVNSQLTPTYPTIIGGAGLRPNRESGSGNHAATNLPRVRVDRLDNGQVRWLTPSAIAPTDASYTSHILALAGFPYGPVQVRVVVNGVASEPVMTVVNVRAPDAPIIGTATAGNGQLSLSFSPGFASDGGSPITGYTATCGSVTTAPQLTSPFTVTGLPNGVPVSCVIYAINAIGSSAPSAASNTVVPQAPQSIVFTSTPPSATAGGATYSPTATGGGSSNPVVFSIAPTSGSVCSIMSGVVSFTAVGSCVVLADQAGDAAFSAAPQVQQAINVAIGSQTIDFPQPSGRVVNESASPVAIASSGLPVTLTSITPTVCTVTASVVTALRVGNCTIRASQAGNANFLAATNVERTFAVGKTNTTLAVVDQDPSFDGETVAITVVLSAQLPGALAPTAPSGTITVTSGSSSCAIALPATSCNLTFATPSTQNLSATYAGDSNFNASASPAIQHLVRAYCNLDVDGDTAFRPSVDAHLILRYLQGLRNTALVAGLTTQDPGLIANRMARMVTNLALDLDGNGIVEPTTDGLMLLRIAIGFRGDAITNGALGAQPRLRSTGQQIAEYVDRTCGTGFVLPP
jgi:N-acetylneuraminic acid mutarotase